VTDLTRPVTRKVTTHRGEVLVVTLTPEGLVIRKAAAKKAKRLGKR